MWRAEQPSPGVSRLTLWKVAGRGTHTNMKLYRLGQLALVGIGTFAAIWIGGVVLALLWAPTSSPSRLVAYLGSMFAVTGAVVAVAVWASRTPR